MLHSIDNLNDVKTFIEQIAQEINNFCPTREFISYVYPDSYFRRYTDEEAAIREKCLERCKEICEWSMGDYFGYMIAYYNVVMVRKAEQSNNLPQTATSVMLFTYT